MVSSDVLSRRGAIAVKWLQTPSFSSRRLSSLYANAKFLRILRFSNFEFPDIGLPPSSMVQASPSSDAFDEKSFQLCAQIELFWNCSSRFFRTKAEIARETQLLIFDFLLFVDCVIYLLWVCVLSRDCKYGLNNIPSVISLVVNQLYWCINRSSLCVIKENRFETF